MTLLLHASDPHFGTEQPPVVEALVRLAHELSPGVLVLSGDLTQRARTAQFAAARAFVDRLRVPVALVIPGNHDVPLWNVAGRALAPYAGLEAAFGPDLEPGFESPDLLVQTVNTTRRWRHKNGEVSPAQVERVARRLERAAPRQLRVVVTHQPVAVERAQDEPDRLRGGHQALRRWSQAGADLVLGGHIHLPYLLPLHERFEGLARRSWVLQAGTAVSRRVRHEAGCSVNVVRHESGPGDCTCRVERWDYRDEQQRFVLVDAQDLKLDRPQPVSV